MRVPKWESKLTPHWRRLTHETLLKHMEGPDDVVTIKVLGGESDWWTLIVVSAHVDAEKVLHVKADVTLRPAHLHQIGISVRQIE
jgi:hypothetical protein